ncbi:MAG: HAMP domain-containing protein [Bacteroidetes bacterium]|nr:MAG: HAMP domain-containing protein [Bacteroidota bacterium]
MKIKKLKIGQKLQVTVLLITGLVFISSIGYISLKNRQRALRDTTAIVDSYAAGYAEQISNSFNEDMAVVRTLAQAFYVHNNMEIEEWKPLFVDMYRQIFENNPDFYALWDSWEYAHVDPEWTLPYGRFLNYHFRKDGRINYQELERSLDGDPLLYGAAKSAGREMIWEPYPDQLEVGATGTTLMTTLTVPMFFNSRYIGLVGVDITLAHLQRMISEIQPFDEAYAFLVSSNGLYAAHPHTEFLEMPLAENLWQDEQALNLTDKIRRGETFSFSSAHEKGENFYYTFAPVFIGETQTPWSMAIAIPVKIIEQEARNQLLISLLIGLFGLLVIGFIIWRVALSISSPVKLITALMQRLARGEIDTEMNLQLQTGDELQQMAEAFNTSIRGLDEKTMFAQNIGKGNLDAELELLSEHDVLGKSLKEMQADLVKARKEETLRQEEDKIRRWSTEGYARFSEILRNNNDNMESLAFDVIQNLVKYLNANQGGIFVYNDEDIHDTFLELKACYAFDRKKYLEKKIYPGEGLVGTSFKEGKTTYLTQLPQNYIRITSGLGDENPGALIIVPLVLNDQIYGVLEIASFHKFVPYQIEFIEKIGESVASTISSVKVNLQTAVLLEKSQQQAEEMKAQEEEMRQNMEELHATQEEMARKSAEMEGILKALDSSSYVIEYDLNGKIINISDSYLKLLSISRQDVLGTHHADKMELSAEQKTDYEEFWSLLKKGNTQYQEVKINVAGKTFWLAETYTPIFDQNGVPYKIFKIANNITDSKTMAIKLAEENQVLKQKIEELTKEK